MTRRFFVLSSGRAGSRSTATALDAFANVSCPHHPRPEPILEAADYWRDGSSADQLVSMLHGRDCPQPIVGEVNLQWSLCTGLIRREFPDAQFVWLIRDGRDSVASMFARGWYDPEVDPVRRAKWAASRLQGDEAGSDELVDVRFDPDFTAAGWANLSPFEKCCWAWRQYNRIIERAVGDDAGCRTVRLDQLQSELPELARFLGLEGSLPAVRRTNVAKQDVLAWDDWDDQHRDQFQRLCGEDMDRWFPEWRSATGWQRLAYDSDQTPRDRPSGKPAGRRSLIRSLANRVLNALNRSAAPDRSHR